MRLCFVSLLWQNKVNFRFIATYGNAFLVAEVHLLKFEAENIFYLLIELLSHFAC